MECFGKCGSEYIWIKILLMIDIWVRGRSRKKYGIWDTQNPHLEDTMIRENLKKSKLFKNLSF